MYVCGDVNSWIRDSTKATNIGSVLRTMMISQYFHFDFVLCLTE